MKMKIVLPFLFAALASCEEEVGVTLQPAANNYLVVEGVLTNENVRHLIRLSLPYSGINGTPQPATGAAITISEGANVYTLTETPAGSGLYYTDSMIAVVSTTYRLDIQYKGKSYFAEDSSVPVEPLGPLEYQRGSDTLMYTIVFNKSGTTPNYVQYEIDWTNTSFCISGQCRGEVYFYDLKTTDVNEIFKPSKAEFDFPPGSAVVRRKYSASPGYQAFLRGVLSETEWRGGIFDVERANAPTNLSDGAIGYFAVSTVVSDSTVIR